MLDAMPCVHIHLSNNWPVFEATRRFPANRFLLGLLVRAIKDRLSNKHSKPASPLSQMQFIGINP